MNFLKMAAVVFFLSSISIFSCTLYGTELEEHLQLWEANAPYCNGFPSKISEDNQQNNCDDGDSVLFAGLLCGAGDNRGCATVQNSINTDGRWFRSPRRKLTDNDNSGNSFSPDMALGAQIYLAAQKDYSAANLWYNWLEDQRPCTLTENSKCKIKGIPRFCTDDSEKGCTMQPSDLAILAETRHKLGIKSAIDSICPNALRSINEIWTIYLTPWLVTKGIFYLTDISCGAASDFIYQGSRWNDLGFPLHLIASEIFLLRLIGHSSLLLNEAANMLAQRQPENPFFLYLRDGPTPEIIQKTIQLCPKNQNEINLSRKSQWAWERSDSEHAWKDSMLWDCIFMAKLLRTPYFYSRHN